MFKKRRRKLILEKNSNSSKEYLENLKGQNNNISYITQRNVFRNFEPYKSNRFIVFLEDEYSEKIITPEKINGFKFFSTHDKGDVICIESLLLCTDDEWIEEYKTIHICKLHLLDAIGTSIKYMEFDVEFIKCEYELSYSKSENLSPKFYYKIFK